MENFYVYILSNKNRTVLYTGITNNLERRLFQYRSLANAQSFTARYNVHELVYFETHISADWAIYREKMIKKKSRKAKGKLIREFEIRNKEFIGPNRCPTIASLSGQDG